MSAIPTAPVCPKCRARLQDDDEVKCPNCGRWLRLPRNEYLVALSEMPDMGASFAGKEPAPWKELSPSIAFLISVVILSAGVRSSTLVIPIAGGLLAIVSLVWATYLEFRANRASANAHGDPAAMGMLPQSSDWPALRGRRFREADPRPERARSGPGASLRGLPGAARSPRGLPAPSPRDAQRAASPRPTGG